MVLRVNPPASGERGAATRDSAAGLEVTALANEGVLVNCAGFSVLIDALFDITSPPGAPPRLHDHLPRSLQDSLESAQKPFDGVNLVLVTHGDDDHFTAGAVAAYMMNNTACRLICTAGVKEALKNSSHDFERFEDRTIEMAPRWGESKALELGAVKVTALGLRHSGSDTCDASVDVPQPRARKQHQGYLLEFPGFRVVHLGDAMSLDKDFARLPCLRGGEIDVAVVPYWFFEEQGGIELLETLVKANCYVVVHINRGNREAVIGRIADLKDELPCVSAFAGWTDTKRF